LAILTQQKKFKRLANLMAIDPTGLQKGIAKEKGEET
jgi:hypothetical protein